MCHAHRLEPVNSRRWDLFNPLVPCPDGGALKRVGSSEDGGKWLCAETLEAPCVVYSIGSNGQYDWELAVLDVSYALRAANESSMCAWESTQAVCRSQSLLLLPAALSDDCRPPSARCTPLTAPTTGPASARGGTFTTTFGEELKIRSPACLVRTPAPHCIPLRGQLAESDPAPALPRHAPPLPCLPAAWALPAARATQARALQNSSRWATSRPAWGMPVSTC